MGKILFLGAGSKKDSGFEDITIDNIPYKSYMAKNKIQITDPIVIESCHGCYELMKKYSQEMQSLVERGNKVVAVLQGGFLFALPSIQATQVTFPIISCPLDFVSYQAFMVPSGHAVVATVGIERKIKGILQTNQREKALKLAAKILNLKSDSVAIYGSEYKSDDKLKELEHKLEHFGITVSDVSKLTLYFSSSPHLGNSDEKIDIWAASEGDYTNGKSLEKEEELLRGSKNTLQVRGLENLANYTAKIISLERPDVREKIKEIGEKKKDSYENRDLYRSIDIPFVGGKE